MSRLSKGWLNGTHKKALPTRARPAHSLPMPQKCRDVAFWEDRYHATTIQTNQHLTRFIAYIDLNMVRADVVKHPNEWSRSGYNEIQRPKQRSGVIDFKRYMSLVQIEIHDELMQSHQQLVEETLKQLKFVRKNKWNQSIASEINCSWNKSKNGWEFGPKAVRFKNVTMNISFVKDRPLRMIRMPRSMKIYSFGN